MNPASNHSKWGQESVLSLVLVPLGSCEQMGLGHGPFCQPGDRPNWAAQGPYAKISTREIGGGVVA